MTPASKAAGFDTPTPIQAQAIPVVLNDGDVLGLAQTGTGKTAAFVLPILQRLTKGPLRRARALIVAPTRELAEQIPETIVQLGAKTKVRSVPIYGGVSKIPQIRALRNGAEIIVACPGRLLDLHNERMVDLSQIEVLVLDEADRMFDMGFLPDIRRIVNLLPKQRQNLFFSATMPDDIRKLADEVLVEPTTVQVDIIAPAKTVSHALYPITQGLKTPLLLSMLAQMDTDRVLIFTRTKRRARNLASTLSDRRYRVTALQGNMSQPARQAAMDGFRSGKYQILVATDIAARGIDVAEISHVINFDMPDTVDAYTHRIGRTGRAQATGDAFTFAEPDDAPMIREIEKVLNMQLEQRQLDGFNYSGFVPEIAVRRLQTGRSQASRQARPAPQRRSSAPATGQNGGQRHSNGNGQRTANGHKVTAAPASADGGSNENSEKSRRRWRPQRRRPTPAR
ncbi:MAG: DEAD/DEAH box helicase [Caldilineaceae bacterium]